MADKIRIAVFDDHPLFRAGVVHTLASEPDLEVVGQGSSAHEAIQIARERLPDLVLLDLDMPGGGMSAIEAIVTHWPSVKTVLLTVASDEEQVLAAMQMGAQGYIAKGVSGVELVSTLKAIHSGQSYVSPELAAKVLTQMKRPNSKRNAAADPFADLTGREEQVLSFVAQGLTNKEIGNSLSLSEKTVKHHITNVLQKLHARNRVEIAIMVNKKSPGTQNINARLL